MSPRLQTVGQICDRLESRFPRHGLTVKIVDRYRPMGSPDGLWLTLEVKLPKGKKMRLPMIVDGYKFDACVRSAIRWCKKSVKAQITLQK